MESYVAPPGVSTENGHKAEAVVRIVRMERGSPVCWSLMPFLVARMKVWGERWGQADLQPFIQRFEEAFLHDQPQVMAWVAVDVLSGKIVGHLAVAETLYNGHKLGLMVQVAADRRAVPMEVQRAALREAEVWAKAQGHTELIMITARKRPRAWRKLYDLHEHRYIYRKVLGGA